MATSLNAFVSDVSVHSLRGPRVDSRPSLYERRRPAGEQQQTDRVRGGDREAMTQRNADALQTDRCAHQLDAEQQHEGRRDHERRERARVLTHRESTHLALDLGEIVACALRLERRSPLREVVLGVGALDGYAVEPTQSVAQSGCQGIGSTINGSPPLAFERDGRKALTLFVNRVILVTFFRVDALRLHYLATHASPRWRCGVAPTRSTIMTTTRPNTKDMAHRRERARILGDVRRERRREVALSELPSLIESEREFARLEERAIAEREKD